MKRSMPFAVLIVLLAAAVSWSDPFINEPIDHWPDVWEFPAGTPIENPWVTQPPYQRNIRYTFDNGLDVYAPVYQGTDDRVLWTSDFVQPSANITWFPDDPSFTGNAGVRSGLIGIDNRQGSDNVTGEIIFHIDNWDSPNDWKHIWGEYVYTYSNLQSLGFRLNLPAGYQEVYTGGAGTQESLGHGYYLFNDPDKVWPNPPWEEVVLTFTVEPGGYFALDEAHFATECVPEPASVTLIITSVGVLLALRRRRRP